MAKIFKGKRVQATVLHTAELSMDEFRQNTRADLPTTPVVGSFEPRMYNPSGPFYFDQQKETKK